MHIQQEWGHFDYLLCICLQFLRNSCLVFQQKTNLNVIFENCIAQNQRKPFYVLSLSLFRFLSPPHLIIYKIPQLVPFPRENNFRILISTAHNECSLSVAPGKIGGKRHTALNRILLFVLPRWNFSLFERYRKAEV